MMNIGLLWFDDSKKPFPEKLSAAARRHTERFGSPPTLCLVNEAEHPGVEAVAGVKIEATKRVQPGHLWLGRPPEQE